MHELKVAETIISTVKSEMAANGYVSVSEIGLRIGEMTDIVEDSLLFGLEVLTKGTEFEGIKIEIEHVPLQGRCDPCQNRFNIIDFKFSCPSCSGGKIEVVAGKEIDISYLEVDVNS